MDTEQLRKLLEQIRQGDLDVDDAIRKLKSLPFEDLGFRPSAIPAHVNEVEVGELGGVTVAAVKAKVLPCDGASWQEAGLPARSLALSGCLVNTPPGVEMVLETETTVAQPLVGDTPSAQCEMCLA